MKFQIGKRKRRKLIGWFKCRFCGVVKKGNMEESSEPIKFQIFTCEGCKHKLGKDVDW